MDIYGELLNQIKLKVIFLKKYISPGRTSETYETKRILFICNSKRLSFTCELCFDI